MTHEPTLDPAGFERLHRIGGEALLQAMVAAFLENAPLRVTAALEAHAARDREGVARAAHSLKSTAGNLGATAVQRAAERLESGAATAGEEEFDALVAELEARFERLVTRLRDGARAGS
jgi:HPt (histidine-containing phosphotransfer) domain-containing protein